MNFYHGLNLLVSLAAMFSATKILDLHANPIEPEFAGAAYRSSNTSTAWSFRIMTDPISDKVRGIASVQSERYSLVVKCDFQARGVYVSLNREPLGFAWHRGAITHRFDQLVPITSEWSRVGDSLNIFDTENVSAFVAGARNSNRIVLRIPENFGTDRYSDVIFSGRGASVSISQVYRACDERLPT